MVSNGRGRDNLFKIIIGRDLIFSSKCAKTCLAAGLRPDPLGELKVFSAYPLVALDGHEMEYFIRLHIRR